MLVAAVAVGEQKNSSNKRGRSQNLLDALLCFVKVRII